MMKISDLEGSYQHRLNQQLLLYSVEFLMQGRW